ncbi:MAG: proton-conducting transporter membrane subunit [Candidatus Omnitrophica bacterium]|nr:proton-conducting transporter membrane subunit [Candidatus Omnitrophota bacterium]
MSLLPLLIIIPLGSGFLIPLFGRKIKGIADLMAIFAAFLSFALSLLFALELKGSGVLACSIGDWIPPVGLAMVIDGLSGLMLVVMNLVAFLVAIYSVAYVKDSRSKWKFFTLLMIMVSGINGVLLAGDIFNMFVFLEVAAMAGYFLVAFGTGADELEASFKYAVMGVVASVFILIGIAFLYSYTSTLNLADMANTLAIRGPSMVLPFVATLFFMGFGLKAALVPFHAWLPYAHSSAPAPVSAMLSGVSIKVLGIYVLARIFFNVFGLSPAISLILITLGILSMVIGSVLAFGQSDIKRLFAYSSIGQIGYIALGLGIGTPLAIFGALFHLFNHSISKSLLFLNSGAIEHSTGTRDLNKMSGILSAMPVTGYTTLVGSLSICGLPPLAGFWGKIIIIFACIKAGRPAIAFIAASISILTLAYYFKALTPALFGAVKENGSKERVKEASLAMMLPMLILAFVSIAGAVLLLPAVGQFLFNSASSVLSNGAEYANVVIGALK